MTPATKPVPALPVPTVPETIRQVLRSASAVLTPEQLAELSQVANTFAAGPGPRLQAQLEESAAKQDAAGSNWMASAWNRLYLEGRGPLQTTTNVGFQLTVPGYRPGIDGVVALIHRAATVHLAEAAGETEPELGFRGVPMSMDQYQCLNGGLRIPRPGCDSWEPARSGRANRAIGVLAQGRMWKVALTNPDGELLPASDLRAALEQVCADSAATGSGFAELSALGSDELAELLHEIDSPQHRDVVRELRDMLFMVSVIEPDQLPAHTAEVSSNGSNRRDIALLRALTFTPGTVWAYKPITYQVGLSHALVTAHIEHSTIDGATLAEAWRRINTVPHPATHPKPAPVRLGCAPRELSWTLTDAQRNRVGAAVERSRTLAQQICAAHVVIPRPLDDDQPFRSSADARAQLIAQVAQLLTFGRIRSVYEAVDMRGFQAGRTEALRPVTPESVAFAAALANNSATRAQLDAALNAHRAWVKRVKRGAGVDRHVLMLQETAHSPDPFLSSPLLQEVRADFFSTSSLGGADPVIRFIYAPTCPGGFGLNYTMYSDRGEYLVTWRRDEADQAHALLQNLQRAGDMFWAFVMGLGGSDQAGRS